LYAGNASLGLHYLLITGAIYTFNTSLHALYSLLIPHMLLALVHHTVGYTFKGTVNLKPLHPGH